MKRVKFTTAYTFEPSLAKAEEHDKLEPDEIIMVTSGQAFTIPQMLQRYANGIPLPTSRNQQWIDESEDDFNQMDELGSDPLTQVDNLINRKKQLEQAQRMREKDALDNGQPTDEQSKPAKRSAASE